MRHYWCLAPRYERVREMVEHPLSFVRKASDSGKLCMLSGRLRSVKDNAYAGVSGIVPYTVLSPVVESSTSTGYVSRIPCTKQ